MSAPNSDIVPIQLSLTAGDLITLWAPRWKEGGEEWEAFLGDEDALFVFPDAAVLAAFVRSTPEHDLADHPAWPLVRRLRAAELVPAETQCYDLVGVPELAAEDPDTWTVTELSELISMVRSLADTCGLSEVHEVLDTAPGFALLDQGALAFGGREGGKLWEEMSGVLVERWDEVLDALDGLVREPEVDAKALATARAELAEDLGEQPGPAAADEDAAEGADGFWERVGIDPIVISTEQADHYTLRCYLDDKPVFLGARGRVTALPSARALARYLADDGADGHDLTAASTWPEVVAAAAAGELVVEVDPENTYQLTGLGEDIADGPEAIDPNQLDLGVELLEDVAEWAGDPTVGRALAPSQSLGWLTSFVLRPDPTRLAPSPPFDDEAGRWNGLVDAMLARMRRPS